MPYGGSADLTSVNQQISDLAAQVAGVAGLTNYNILGPTGAICAALGDSITAYEKTGAPNVCASWYEWAVLLSSGKLQNVKNAGVVGDLTLAAYNRIDTDIIPYKPLVCFVMLGTNDAIMGTFSIINYENVIIKLLQNKITPIAFTIPNNGNSVSTGARQINSAITSVARKYRLPLVDFFTLLTDPSTGKMYSTYTGDYVHPNSLAATIMGQYVVDTICPLLAANSAQLPVATDSTNLITTPFFNADTNADGVADNWTASGGAYTGVIDGSDSNIVGSWQKITKTAANTTAVNFKSNTFSIPAGETARVSFRIKTENVTANGATINVTFNTSPYRYYIVPPINRDIDEIIDQEIILPTGITATFLNVEINNNIAGVSISQVKVTSVTATNATVADTVNITANLTNVTGLSSGYKTKGLQLIAGLTPTAGHTITSVTVIMGGVDVTATAWNSGLSQVRILAPPGVTGDLVVTAIATLT